MTKLHDMLRAIVFAAAMLAAGMPAYASESTPTAGDGARVRVALPLTSGEQRYLASLPTLRVAYDPHFAPFTSQNADGQPEGIAHDYLTNVAGQLGLRLQFTASASLANTQELIAHDQIDMVLAFNPRGRAGTGLTFSRPYVEFPLVIATRDDTRSLSGIDDLAGRRIAANLNREAVLRLLESATTPPQALSVSDTDGGLAMLADGKVDAMVGNLATVDYLIRSRYPQLRTGAPTGLTEPLSFAVVPRMAPLAPLLDRALARIDSREQQRIANTWLSVRYVYGDLPALLLQRATPYLLTLLPVLAVALYFLWGFTRERRWRRQTELQLADVTMNLPAVVYRFHVMPTGKVQFRYIGGDSPSIFGLTAHAIIDDEPSALATVDPDDRTTLIDSVVEATRALTPLHSTVRVHANGRMRWITSHGIPRRLNDGVTEFNGYWIDVTEQREQADALALAKDAAESATHAKTEFLTTMSHEIRTPMNGVLGMLELLADTPLEDEQRDLLGTAGDSAQALLQILNDVLDFSKIEAGKLSLLNVATDVRQVIDGAVAVLAGGAHAKNLAIRVTIDAAVAARLMVDDTRLRQVVVNLVSNAIKFTAAGHVAVDVALVGRQEDRQRLRLEVSDTGIGIDAATLGGLFTPFTQAEASTSRRFGGTGLGLAICRRLVELMGGSITMQSVPGAGTSVIVEWEPAVLEYSQATTPLSNHTASIRLRDARSAHSLGHYLTACGIVVVAADIDADIVFIDEGTSANCHAIHVSHAPDARGFHRRDGTLVATDNPWRWHSMRRLCEQALGLQGVDDERRAQHHRAMTIQTAPMHHGTILVADDHPTNRILVRAQLKKLGYRCDVVNDGQAALDALIAGNYALLIVDCQMPAMDGYTLARQWREREAGSNARLPIVAMTASALAEEPARCLSAGMDDFLTKPTNLRSLGDSLERWMPVAGNGADLSTMLANFGDANTVLAIAREFLNVARADLVIFDNASATAHAEDIYQLVHRMVGAMLVFGPCPVVVAGDTLSQDLDSLDDAQAMARFAAWRPELDAFLTGLACWIDENG